MPNHERHRCDGATVVLALFGTAFAGVGLPVGGVLGTRFAAPVAAALGISSFLLELLGNALRLPDWLVDLSLNGHVCQPLVGSCDAASILAFLALAVGGLLVGAWGWQRRGLRSGPRPEVLYRRTTIEARMPASQ